MVNKNALRNYSKTIDGSKIVNEKLIKEIEIKKPTNIVNHCALQVQSL